MYYPSKSEFIKLSKKGNLIPVYKEILADMETPVSAFSKIEGEYSFLLESVEGGEKIGRYSFLGSGPVMLIRSTKDNIEVVSGSKKTKFKGDPLKKLKEMLSSYKPVKIKGLPPFHGGLVGYMSYDAVRLIEDIPDKNPDDLKVPDMQFMLTDTILVFDHVKHKITIISNAVVEGDPAKAYNAAVKKIDGIVAKMSRAVKVDELELKEGKKIKIGSNYSRAEFEGIVRKAINYVKSGDVIQVVPSQRFTAPVRSKPFNVYRALRTLNPSPYMYYLKFSDMELVGSSPETMVKLEGSTANIRPIAGTRPRGASDAEDAALVKELLADEKEKAEHIMLVDLARNDLGRVCGFNTIKINELMNVEKYSHVMHIVSDVTGEMKPGLDAFDLIRASFPAGTVTGAPKVRAMQIIDELENVKRGTYAGAVGYFDFYGNLDTCITIRTILIKGKKAYMQAGMGVVADSVPANEYEESINKAKALVRALEMSEG
jgi:anthranilate synthase component 1